MLGNHLSITDKGKRITFYLLFIVLALISDMVFTDDGNQPLITTNNDLNWQNVKQIPGLSFVWISGGQEKNELYVIRVKLNKGSKIPAHTHPDNRITTILQGDLYVGFASEFDVNRLKIIKSSEVYHVPAKQPHFLMAKDSDVIYQEIGMGPTKTTFLN